MRAPQRKPEYGRYRFRGLAQSRISWTRQGATIEYAVVEHDHSRLEVTARAVQEGVPIEARVEVTARSSEEGVVRCTIVEEPSVSGTLLDMRAAAYAVALVMHWEWAKRIEVDVPKPIARGLRRSMHRRFLKYVRGVDLEGNRRLLCYLNLP